MTKFKFLIISILQTFSILAQDTHEVGSKVFIGDVQFVLGQGQGRYGEQYGSPLGLSFNLTWQGTVDGPVFYGVGFRYGHHQSFSRMFYQVIDGETYPFDERSSSNFMDLEARMRVFLPFKLLWSEPYVDLGLGGKGHYTFTSTTSDEIDDNDFDINKLTIGPVGSVGLGLAIPLKEEYFINVKGNYAMTLSQTYFGINESVSTPAQSIDAFALRKGTTNLLSLEIGLLFVY